MECVLFGDGYEIISDDFTEITVELDPDILPDTNFYFDKIRQEASKIHEKYHINIVTNEMK